MYKIEITSVNNSKSYTKEFESKKDANKWFKLQQSKRALSIGFGASFSNNTIEVSKLY